MKRLRFITTRAITPEQQESLSRAAQVTFLPMEAISEKGELDLSQYREIEDVRTGYTQFFDGDVVVAKITPCFENGKGAVIHDTLNGVGYGTTELHVLRPRPELDKCFLYYVTVSESFRKLGEAAMTGAAGQKRVPEEFVRDFRIPLPPLTTQRAIADYLDRETAQIDALVAAKEQVLALLAEKRRALITRAVTRGLDPHTPLRESGVVWLGEIPAHWKSCQLKFISTSLQTGPFGSQLHAEHYVVGGIPAVNPAHLSGGRIFADERVTVDDATAARLSMHRMSVGDIVFARRGELGRCAVVEPHQSGWLCGTGSLRVRLKLDLASPHFISLIFNATQAAEGLRLESVGSTMDNLNTEILGAFPLELPPLHEQRAIVAHITAETSRLDALAAATRRSITLLKERRSALIAAAVTGQMQFPEIMLS